MTGILKYAYAALAGLTLILGGCGGSQPQRPAPAAARVESAEHGPVSVTMTITPGTVSIDRHIIFSIKAVFPTNIAVNIPPLSDRFEGFVPGSSFDRTSTAGDKTALERVVRLTPAASGTYRIAPIPVTYRTTGPDDDNMAWFPTPAIRLELEKIISSTGEFSDQIEPVWIRPSAKSVLIYILAAVLAVVLILVAIKLIHRLLRHIRILRMSPRDRALMELGQLLEKDLVEKNKVKEFYVELTMIVRLFIERGYGVRAPEQTTEEFLATASNDDRFTGNILDKLRSFLSSADLVKFAGFQPDSESTGKAVADAQAFIKVESSGNPDTMKKQEVANA